MAIQNAPSPEMQMEAADKFVTGFADSTLKSTALFMAANAAERKNDTTKAIVYGQSAIDADPKNYQAMILVAGELARGRMRTIWIRKKSWPSGQMANEASN